ncbi:alpha/beta fold hydrolase, partial [Leucobacter sp. M11]|uniref:alpha/beta fold hydrolase n=1 Tax=Leucobacter sp. M11 TaxID=2993565 RepID=UPI002D7F2C5D
NPKFAQAQAKELLLPDAMFPAYLEQSRHAQRETLREVLRANLSFRAPEPVLAHARPTRLWWGEREPAAVRDGMAAAAAAHPNLDTVTWAAGRHGIMFQDPERFAAETRDFLSR